MIPIPVLFPAVQYPVLISFKSVLRALSDGSQFPAQSKCGPRVDAFLVVLVLAKRSCHSCLISDRHLS